MSTSELQSLKMAWLAAKEAGDTQAQLRLLRDHPSKQAELITFIAAHAATEGHDEEPHRVAVETSDSRPDGAMSEVGEEDLFTPS